MEDLFLGELTEAHNEARQNKLIENWNFLDGVQRYNLYKSIKGEKAISISKFRGMNLRGCSLDEILKRGGDRIVRRKFDKNNKPKGKVKEENKITERQKSYIKQCIELGYSRCEVSDNPILKGITASELSYYFNVNDNL